jgi:hypothetical protein
MGRSASRFLSCLFLLLLATAFWSSRSAWAQYPQIRLNTDGTNELQNEQQICVNPTDPSNVVACWRDFRLGFRQVGVAFSIDGGWSWVDFLIGGELPWDSDPVLVVDDDGTFYLVVINFENNGPNQLAVHRSVTGGLTWEGPFSAVYSSGTTFEDKEWIAVDRTGGPRDGNLYIHWARFNEVRIFSVTSTDRGETWSDPVPVSDPGHFAQWPVPVVMRNGDVLTMWNSYDSEILYDISTDGGATWGDDRLLTPTGTNPQDMINGNISVFPYTSLAVDESMGPRGSWVYCMYADEMTSANGMDIWCRRSANNGFTWSEPFRVNDDPEGLDRDQFHPWVTCDERGVLTAIWYDRRDDSGNYLWHIYMSRSHNGGTTWEENVRITTVPSSPADAVAPETPRISMADAALPLPAGLIGEYSGVAVREGIIHPIWTDTRHGHQDTFVSVLRAPAAIEQCPSLTSSFSLRAYPNPTEATTEILLRVPEPARGSIEIHDTTGRLIRTIPVGDLPVGESMVDWDGRDESGREMAAGVYFARFVGENPFPPIRTKVVLTR